MSSLKRFYRWSIGWGTYLAWGSSAWLSRFLLPAVSLLVLSSVLFALQYRLGGAIAILAFALWGLVFVVLAHRDMGSDIMRRIQKVFP